MCMLELLLSPFAEAQTVEGLFNVVTGLWLSTFAKLEHVAVGNVLLQLSLAEDHGALSSLCLGASQQDIGSMTSTFQQRGFKCYDVIHGTGWLKEDFGIEREEHVRMPVAS